MPLHCPHCQIVQAEGNKICINCGQPLTATPAAPALSAAPVVDPALLAEAAASAPPSDHGAPFVPDPGGTVQGQRPSWRLPALIAVGLLLALAASAFLVARSKRAVRTALASPTQAQTPDTAPPLPVDTTLPLAAPAPPQVETKPAAEAKSAIEAKPAVDTETTAAQGVAETLPLAITLTSKSAGRHVKVGEDVTLIALTEMARGHSATLTMFYQREEKQKTMLAFVQGSLCSVTWTPSVPGRYEFMATALSDRRQAAASSRIVITVDKPAPQRTALDKGVPSPHPVAAAPQPPRRQPPPAITPTRTVPHPAPPASDLIYHVAAAHFAFPRSAYVLSDALNHRGYHAVPERMADSQGKPVYVVVTGSYHRPSEARSATLALQRSGYPAYFFSSR